MAGVDVLATAFNGGNAAFIADMYARWLANPASVDESFGELFTALNDESRAVLSDAVGASWAPRHFALGPEPVSRPDAAQLARPRPRSTASAIPSGHSC